MENKSLCNKTLRCWEMTVNLELCTTELCFKSKDENDDIFDK
jgi:hypothetical protein